MRQIVLDTETTGLEHAQGHRIVEIGCIEMIDRQFTGNNFHQYLNPQRIIDEEAISVHNITTEFLSDKPLFSEIADNFLNFINGAEIIAHNAPFDIDFLNNELKLASNKYKTIENYATIFDTLVLARKMFPGQHNNLSALCKRYKINTSSRTFHGAFLDAQLLAELYLFMTCSQSSLFEEEDFIKQINYSDIEKEEKNCHIKTDKKFTVIYASQEELKEHMELLLKWDIARNDKKLIKNTKRKS